jgi:cell division protein FtsB
VTTVWRAVTKLLGWLVALVLVCIGLAYFKPQLDRQGRMESELASLRAEKSRLAEENHKLKSRLEWLKQDPEFLEVLARDRLDLARKGETVFRFAPDERRTPSEKEGSDSDGEVVQRIRSGQ